MELPEFAQLRAELLRALASKTDQLQEALRSELANGFTFERGSYLQFEIDDFFFGVSSCASEETIIPGDWLDAILPADWFERAELHLGGWNELIAQEMCPWFAESWQAVGGPAVYTPAYIFFHWYPQDQYDLEQRRWISYRE